TGTVMADPERLQQVLWNLLSNAVKFTPDQGAVDVVCEQVGTHARISVSDTGPGIDPTLLPHVFERFWQGAVDRKRHGGLGLGLAIAQHLAELHGATLRAEPVGNGIGTRFILELPTVVHADRPVAAA